MARDKEKPVDIDSEDESENSVIYNATRKQSSVSPEDYPDAVKQDRRGTALPEKAPPPKGERIDPGPIRDPE